ncbi:MAG TPA: hypothetical protein VKI44_41560, partial [Acetobacteraceae bacterium]|nr:hypothetical protein [Acetobacteraceae bacterium]
PRGMDGAALRGAAPARPQVIIALAVTRDGMPVRSWILPGDTADVTTVARIKDDLRAWTICGPGGSAAACSSAMPACIRPRTWPLSRAV